MKFHDDQWYSDRDLMLAGIPFATQADARKTGALKFVQADTNCLYKGSDVTAWLDAGAPTTGRSTKTRHTPAPTARPPAASADYSSPALSNGDFAMSEHRNVVQRWDRLLQARMDEGQDRRTASARLARQYPALHRAYLAAVQNTDSQARLVSSVTAADMQLEQIKNEPRADDPVTAFNAAVNREIDRSGCSRKMAVSRVAHRKKRLHKSYVRATNSSDRSVQALIGERFAVANR